MLVWFCDLDLDPMTLIYNCDLDILKMYPHIKTEVSRSRLSKFRAWTDRQRQTDRTKHITTLHWHHRQMFELLDCTDVWHFLSVPLINTTTSTTNFAFCQTDLLFYSYPGYIGSLKRNVYIPMQQTFPSQMPFLPTTVYQHSYSQLLMYSYLDSLSLCWMLTSIPWAVKLRWL